MKVAKATFDGQCASHQILEDSAGYLCYAPEDAMEYAAATGDMRFFESGVARTYAEFIAQVCINNLGYGTGFGDSPGIVMPQVFQALTRAAFYYNDSRLGAIAYRKLPVNCGLRTFQSNLPIDMTVSGSEIDKRWGIGHPWTGMRVFPIYKQTLRKGDGAKEPVFDPKESAGDEWFNKIVFLSLIHI